MRDDLRAHRRLRDAIEEIEAISGSLAPASRRALGDALKTLRWAAATQLAGVSEARRESKAAIGRRRKQKARSWWAARRMEKAVEAVHKARPSAFAPRFNR